MSEKAQTAAAVFAALFLASSLFAQNVALRLLLLGVALLLAAVVAVRERAHLRLLPPIWLPFVLWAAWAAASMAWSVDAERTLKEWRNEVLYTGCALWACYIAAHARAALRVFVPILAVAAVAVCAISLFEYAHGRKEYVTGWHGGPGDHSSTLVLLMPCALMAGWYARRAGAAAWIVPASWALAALFFLSAYATLNRTVWLAFAVQFAVLGAFLAARGRPTLKFAAGVLGAIVVMGGVLLAAQAEYMSTLRSKASKQQDTRIALWPEVAQHIAERPLVGHGFGRGLLRAELQEKLRRVNPNLWHAHNILLDAALQTGVVGLGLLLAVFGATMYLGWRAAFSPSEGVATCGMVLVALVAGMLVRNMTDTLLARQNALLYWGMVGVLLAWTARPWRA